ncbi:MAG TPA: hypothetical protein VGZ23_19480 [bacterium]|nr:hypothetical protein [bacterium]
MAADAFDVRMAHLEGAYEQIDKRLGALEGQIHALRGEIRDLHTEIHGDIRSLRSSTQDQFRWMIGLLILAVFAPTVLRLLGR